MKSCGGWFWGDCEVNDVEEWGGEIRELEGRTYERMKDEYDDWNV